MKNYGVLTILLGLSLAGLAPPALAVQHSHTATARSTVTPYAQYGSAADVVASPLYFANIDRDHDGFLSRAELPQALHDLRAHFSQFDVDGNHRLDGGEYGYYMQGIAEGTCRSGYVPCGVSNPYAVASGP